MPARPRQMPSPERVLLPPLTTCALSIVRLTGKLVHDALRSELLHQSSDGQPHNRAVRDIDPAKKPLGSTSPQRLICFLVEIQLRRS